MEKIKIKLHVARSFSGNKIYAWYSPRSWQLVQLQFGKVLIKPIVIGVQR